MPLLNPAISGNCVLNRLFASNAETGLQTKRQSRPRAESNDRDVDLSVFLSRVLFVRQCPLAVQSPMPRCAVNYLHSQFLT
jgi:hypothetical protein